MNNLYNQHPVTNEVLQEKAGVCPEVQKKRNQVAADDNWFDLAIKKKAARIRKSRR